MSVPNQQAPAVDYDAIQTAAYRDMQPAEEKYEQLRDRVLAECDHLDRLGEDYAGTILNPRTAFQSAANLIRAAVA